MTQSEILKVLKKEMRWMTAQEIANILEQGSGGVSTSLKKLVKYNEILFKEPNKEYMANKRGGKPYLYKII